MRYHEKRARLSGFKSVVGIDEVGRGPLAGPVVSCAVYLKKHNFKNRVADSKVLNEKKRNSAFLEIIENCDFGIGIVNEAAIDQLNILEATKVSMRRALSDLNVNPDLLLIDGPIDLGLDIPSKKIIDGDKKSITIAAASIIAKVIRDRIMNVYDSVYPKYGFRLHKGYPTRKHIKAIKKHGPCLIHRMSFAPLCDERK